MWHKTSEKLPDAGVVVVGLWEYQAMKTWRNGYGQWVDDFHGCYCATAPDYWIEEPKEQ